METILVTGGAGFIGANFINYILKQSNNYKVINFDKLTYAADLSNIKNFDESRYKFVKGDIVNKEKLQEVFSQYDIKHVIHFAAESHVDNSINSPSEFITTNIIGTHNLLEVCRNTWKDNSNRFHHISTDEVFGSLGDEGFFSETTAYAPNSPYSASKASSDMIVRSYGKTYGLNYVITNCSNNFGPFQHDEKLMPTIIRNALKGKSIPIYGNGKNVRDWLYVEDHCKALLKVFKNGKNGETYNIGGDNEYSNIDLAHLICEVLDTKESSHAPHKNLIEFVEDRAGHDFRYAVDTSKIKRELNWAPSNDFKILLDSTINFYLNKYKK